MRVEPHDEIGACIRRGRDRSLCGTICQGHAQDKGPHPKPDLAGTRTLTFQAPDSEKYVSVV